MKRDKKFTILFLVNILFIIPIMVLDALFINGVGPLNGDVCKFIGSFLFVGENLGNIENTKITITDIDSVI
mgnify:CR=1 FL=1